VRKYLLEPEAVPRYGPRVVRPSKLDTHKPYLQDRMKAGVWNAQMRCVSCGSVATKAAIRF
jgi:hypothetical protein